MFFKNENDFKCLVTSQKNFGKYFKVFGCVFENPLENTFSHIFSTSKQIF